MRAILLLVAWFAIVGCGGGGGGSRNNTTQPPGVNTAPTVNAGIDLSARELTTVTLTGSASDSDGTVDGLLWEQTGGPAAQLSAPDQLSLSVQLPDLDCPTNFEFRLTATDDDGDASSDRVTISGRPDVSQFAVDAGPDRKVFSGNSIVLPAFTDLIPCVTQASEWIQTDGTTIPVDQSSGDLEIDGSNITADDDLVFQLTVTNFEGISISDEVTVFARTPTAINVSQNLQASTYQLYAESDRVFAKVANSLLEVNGISGTVRTLAGNTVNLSNSGGQVQALGFLRDLSYDPSRDVLYLANRQLEVLDANPDDGRTAIENILPQSSILGCCNDLAFEVNADSIFYMQFERDTSELYTHPRVGSGGSDLIATVPNGELALLWTETSLLAYGGSISSQLISIDLADGSLNALIDEPSSTRAPTTPTQSDTHVYWQLEDVLYEIDQQTHAVRTVASGLLPVPELTYHDNYVYGVQQPTFASPQEVRRTNVGTGVSEIVTALPRIDGLGFAGDTLYLVARRTSPGATDLYRVDAGVALVVSSLEDFRAGGNAGHTMTYTGDAFVVAADGSELAFFDLDNFSAERLITSSPTEYVVEQDGFVVFGGNRTNNGISGFNATLPIRTPDHLSDTNTWSLVVENNSVYWIYTEQEVVGFAELYKIGTIAVDGTGFQTLFTGTTNELRDISLFSSDVIFACLDDCGAPGWQLASLPTSGGVPEVLVSLGEDPSLVRADNLVYIVSGVGGNQVSVFNLDTLELASLPISLSGSDFVLVAREDIIYVGDSDELIRYEKVAWDELGEEQAITVTNGAFPDNFDVESLSLSDTALYYRDRVLTRLDDRAP